MKILAIVSEEEKNIERRLKAHFRTVKTVLFAFAILLGIYGYAVWYVYDYVEGRKIATQQRLEEWQQRMAKDSLDRARWQERQDSLEGKQ